MNPSNPLVIAIDSSTTATKALVVDNAGNVIASAKTEFPYESPAAGWYEQDPNDWWNSTEQSITKALEQLTDEQRSQIASMAITHQRESFGLFDEAGTPLRPGILWLDERGAGFIETLGTPQVRDLSGKPPGTAASIYKLAWVAANEPELLAEAKKISDVAGYLTFKLSGDWASSAGCLDTLSMFDIAKQEWSDDLLAIGGVRRDQLPRIVTPGAKVASVSDDLTEKWGIAKDLPIIGSCGDGQAAALGAGAPVPSRAYLNLGTAIVAGVLAQDYVPGQAYRTYVSGVPTFYIREVVQHSGAHLAAWYRETFGDPALEGAPDPQLEAAAAAIAPGSDGLLTLPYWNAVQSPHWDSFARGATIGWRTEHTAAHFYRSILEATAYEMKSNLEALEASTGVKIESVRAVGGGARSPLWCQITADILGIPLELPEQEEVSALGAAVAAHAYLAATGEGADPETIIDFAEKMHRIEAVVEPNLDDTVKYQGLYNIQQTLYPALKPAFDRLNEEENAVAKV